MITNGYLVKKKYEGWVFRSCRVESVREIGRIPFFRTLHALRRSWEGAESTKYSRWDLIRFFENYWHTIQKYYISVIAFATNPFLKQAVRLDPYSTIYFSSLGLSYFLIGQYDEAILECKRAANINPKNLHAQLCLTSTYSAAGYEKEARVAAAEILRIYPRFSVEYLSKMSTFQKADKELFIGSLRKAGLKWNRKLHFSGVLQVCYNCGSLRISQVSLEH